MKSWATGFLCLTLIATLAVSANQEQTTTMQSSLDDFKEFSQVMQGRWIADIVWITDWPGFGEKGDTVTGYADYQIAQNGRVLTGREYLGPGSVTSLAYYDQGKRTNFSTRGFLRRKCLEQHHLQGEWRVELQRHGQHG